MKKLVIMLLIVNSVSAQTHHRKYSYNSAHKGEHHYKNTSTYHAERYKYRNHRYKN
jgi:hypothetical protein